MKKIIYIFLFCLVGSANAETYKCVGTHFPYILEKTSSGKIIGIGAEIVTEIMEKLGHNVEIEIYPWKRAQWMVQNGLADILIGPYKTKEREQHLDFSTYPFYQDNMVLYQNDDNQFDWGGRLSELEHLSIAIMAGWSYGEKFDAYKKNLTIYEIQKNEQCFKMLSLNRVDLCASNQRAASRFLKSNNMESNFSRLKISISTASGYFGFSKKLKLDELQIKFNRELERLIKRKTILKMNDKYNLDFSIE